LLAAEKGKEIELKMIGYERVPAGSTYTAAPQQETRSERDGLSCYHRRSYQRAKRIFDIFFSALGLTLLFPVFLIITVVLACVDGFPVVFRQNRVGFKGDPFEIHKFRTMVKNAEEVLRSHPELWEEYKRTYKIQNDPRVSKFGHFLRKSSLDELPQLFNVLRGDMSLVGPRPIVEPELEMYGDQQGVYISMKPGCAGLWQCMGRSATTYEERVEMDREYYENASVWFDLMILTRTVLAILTGRGAR
jgi:lipopolysaccharide/colanic/teichoic acid biosynthesis glycosyltransferase